MENYKKESLILFVVVFFRYVDIIWQMETSPFHQGRSAQIAECSVPWFEVPIWQSFLAEFSGTFILSIASRLISESAFLANNDPLLSAGIFSTLITFTVVAFLEISGGIFNPLLATILVGGCRGHSWADHILIYWIGAISGAIGAQKMLSLRNSSSQTTKESLKKIR